VATTLARTLTVSVLAWLLGTGCYGTTIVGTGAELSGPGGAGSTAGPLCEWSSPHLLRLTNADYAGSLVSLFGAPADIAKDLPSDTYIGGFDNHADALTVSVVHLKAYSAAATRLADQVFASTTQRGALLGCDLLAQKDTCLRSYVERLGRLAFRRPLETEERDALLALAAKISSATDAYRPAKIVFEAVLQSPSFLYRFEAGLPDPRRAGVRRLTGDEIASRLSFLLLGKAPDAALYTRAQAGELDTVDGVESAARGMLGLPQAHGAMQRFAQQWLRLQNLDGVSRSTVVWAGWTEDTPSQMREETSRLLEDYLWSEKSSLLDVLNAPYTYVNSTLAQLYGVPGPAATTTWQRIDLPPTRAGAGVFAHAGILAMTAPTETTSPILRGKWVRDALLCDSPPPPPPGVGGADDLEPGETVRERLSRHRDDPACSGCHQLMDPVGFGLERFDSIGRYRTTDAAGNPLSGEGSLAGFNPAAFVGPAQLAEKVRHSSRTSECVVRHLQRYAFNRTEVPGDQCVTQSLTEAFVSGGQNFRELVVKLVSSDAFRYVGEIQ